MANAEHLAILKQGVDTWNLWRAQYPNTIPDLTEADLPALKARNLNLSGARLDRINLEFSDLRNANLVRAVMRSAKLEGGDLACAALCRGDFWAGEFVLTNLANADFSDANLGLGIFDQAILDGANLRGTALGWASFHGTSFDGTDFDNASMQETVFANTDLSNAKNLERVRHEGPSTVGVDVIFLSKKIPPSFLRGCGVPENVIGYIPSLIDSEGGIQFYSCFISYSSMDEDFARRLHGRMRDAHLRVWFAPEDIQGGKKLHEQIETAIRIYDKLLVVLSKASLQSEWVMTELRNARTAERQSGKRKLFPVRLVDFKTLRDWQCFDADSGKDLAVEVREYFIPDFSNWKDHDQFEAAFSRLLNDLRADNALR